MNQTDYSIEEVREILKKVKHDILSKCVKCDLLHREEEKPSVDIPAAHAKPEPLGRDLSLFTNAVGSGWRRTIRKIIHSLIAWKVSPLVEKINQINDEVDKSINAIQRNIDKQSKLIESAHVKMDQIHQISSKRFDKIEENVDTAREIIHLIEKRFDAIEKMLEQNVSMKKNIDKQSKLIDSAHVKSDQIHRLFTKRFDKIEENVDTAREIIHLIEKRCDAIEKMLEQNVSRINNIDKQKFPFRMKRIEESIKRKSLHTTKDNLPYGKTEHYTDVKEVIDCRLFNELFRGDQQTITERQIDYVNLFRGVPGPVLDIGCGRGEFLELMRKNKFEGYGVDNNHDYCQESLARGINVICQDALTHLGALNGETIGGILACQVLEHQSIEWIAHFLQQAGRCLMDEGKLVIETINPLSITGWHWYLLDPTHRQPLHPELISFLVRQSGFHDVSVQFINPVPDSECLQISNLKTFKETDANCANIIPEIIENTQRLNKLLFGFQDYYLVASMKKIS